MILIAVINRIKPPSLLTIKTDVAVDLSLINRFYFSASRLPSRKGRDALENLTPQLPTASRNA
jgi:hypothetical protein